MSAATNDTNNIITSISIAVPDRLLNAIEWTVNRLTDAIDESLTQYQTSLMTMAPSPRPQTIPYSQTLHRHTLA